MIFSSRRAAKRAREGKMPTSQSHEIQYFLAGVGVSFMIPAISNQVSRKTLIVLGGSILLAACLWPSLAPILPTTFVSSAQSVAVNFWAWFELLMILLAYLVFFAAYPSFRRYVTLPRLYAEDRAQLIKSLNVKDWNGTHKVQILYANRPRCRDFAEEISAILTEAGWTEPSPPSPPAFGTRMPREPLALRASLIGPASQARLKLSVAFREVGWEVASKQEASLRKYDYCMLFINGF
jgi:hypothetical protein